ncbi:alpha-glucosidase [Enterococcus raffinosus]|uniref:Alpha-glucosidase n=1 Tax=Enterococcus raffinosus TaxID=71452 RepID=A0AAW8TBK7_9ENTE|nr:alpha-glucosidase [Enterococcus raffinosus]MDT2524314.1 alpha-glucosidase [Enterococcus raffinosus]MDT2530551.1 alpha-glucosidase [Enterococcus raffinosus]MDT2535247.1 alpha-glucosidase [Enterococcus raffinosus]MDT2545201.1 alpha-glucosidase [Enterococcus raffinosus]MDT2578712.1 alpha-glucosidase [Enterococcus raffinosus]
MEMILKEKQQQNEEQNFWKEEVVYQIYPKSFYDSNGDGIGDIKGITQKLGYLAELGVTMLWICPIFTSPMVDNGYDIADYKGIQAEFGTIEDLTELIEAAKARGMKVILDLVVNHSSDKHEWFQAALADPKSPYRDYYIFKAGKAGNLPNNWRSIFGGSVWEPVPDEENMYYFHTFDKKQPDLNWENPALRREIYEMINWWLEKGIVGFRIDSITFIKKDQDYGDVEIDGSDGLGSVKNKTRNRPGIEKFLTELNRETFQKYRCVSVGEAPGVPYDQYDQYIGEDGYFNMIFDFHYADVDVENGSEWFRRTNWQTQDLKELVFKSQNAIQKSGWGANFLENHDQPRSLSKYITDERYQNEIGAKALGTIFFFLRGTPFIYQGQEIGMKNFQRESIEDFNDVSSIDNYHRSLLEGFSKEEALNFVNQRSRDNTRTPFPWNATVNAGFSKSNESWLKLTGDQAEVNAADQLNRSDSVFSHYQQMIHLRNHSEYRDTLIYGQFVPLNTADAVIAYERVGKETVQVFVNLSNQQQEIETSGEVLLNNYHELQEQAGTKVLQPYQAVVIRKDENHD